jgi:hypothetical protein
MEYEPVKTHYRHFMYKLFTFCGFLISQVQQMTVDPDKVTCKRCLKSMKIYALGIKQKELNELPISEIMPKDK